MVYRTFLYNPTNLKVPKKAPWVVSVNADAGGGGGLATCKQFLESQKSGNWDSFLTGKKTTVVTLMLLTRQSEWI